MVEQKIADGLRFRSFQRITNDSRIGQKLFDDGLCQRDMVLDPRDGRKQSQYIPRRGLIKSLIHLVPLKLFSSQRLFQP